MKVLSSGLVIAAIISFIGCSGGNSDDEGAGSTSVVTGTAYYIDSAVSGINYTCGSQEGTTGANGLFTFEEGESCTFYLGDVELHDGKNKLVKQMSQEWILGTLRKLQKHKPLSEYKSIRKLVQNDQYRARLFKMFPVGKDKIQIYIYRIKNKGMKSFDTFIESKLRPITIAEPGNSFEREGS